jgi:hypothetical protein
MMSRDARKAGGVEEVVLDTGVVFVMMYWCFLRRFACVAFGIHDVEN